MREEYVKEWMETYLQLFPEHPLEHDYTEKMAVLHPGNGRLEFSKELQNGTCCYRYKVSGKKALAAVYAAIPMKEEQIRGLLDQLVETLEDSREYLLREEDFLLDPAHIFVTLPQFQTEFCYVPGYGVRLMEQLEGLMEYLLNRVDYDDKPAVELLYDCHTLCMKEEAGLSELKRRLERKRQVTSVKTPVVAEKPAQTVYETGQSSYLSWIKERLPGKWKRREERTEENEYPEHPVKVEYLRERLPEPAWQQEEDSRTVLLAVQKPDGEAQLLHEQTGEIIPLTKFPFYVGSAKEYTTHTLTGNGISRLHFCIQKKGKEYWISDLNSTNGTYLNGTEVIPGVEQRLAAQDRIKAAGEEFLFSCFGD